MLNIVKRWFAVLDHAASDVLCYSRTLNSYRNESYTDLDTLSIGE